MWVGLGLAIEFTSEDPFKCVVLPVLSKIGVVSGKVGGNRASLGRVLIKDKENVSSRRTFRKTTISPPFSRTPLPGLSCAHLDFILSYSPHWHRLSLPSDPSCLAYLNFLHPRNRARRSIKTHPSLMISQYLYPTPTYFSSGKV